MMSKNLWYFRGSCSNWDLTLSTKETASVLMSMLIVGLEGEWGCVCGMGCCCVEGETEDQFPGEWVGFLWEFGGSQLRIECFRFGSKPLNNADRKTAK